MPRFPRRSGALLIPALVLGALAGCGQKGPLYLPEEQPTPPPPARPLEPAGLPAQPVPDALEAEPLNEGLSAPVPAPLGAVPLEPAPESAEEPPAEPAPE